MLPKIDVPVYEMTLPSNGKKISYRPFLVKEEKIMLIASNSKDQNEIKTAIKQLVRNCVLDTDFDVDNAPVFDIEYILINLRIKSVGNEITTEYVCNNVVNDKECNHAFKVVTKLDEIQTIKNEKIKSEIWLTKDLGVKMQYPKFSTVRSEEEIFDYGLLADCVEYVFDKSQTYSLKDQSKEEIAEFFDSLSRDQFAKINEFLENVPRFESRKTHKCEKCGFEHTLVKDDYASFF